MSLKTITPDQALALIEGYRKVPNEYISDVYGLSPWSLQSAIVDSVFKNPQTAVKTCNAVGKSYIAAAVAHAFLDLYPGSIVVTTAPTWRQVKDVLWRYFGTMHKSARYSLGGQLNQTGLEYDTDWYAVGLSTKYPENFFGYHADHILVIVDEAGGVEDAIFRGVKAITPNVNARVLYIGNPTNPDGFFAQLFDEVKSPRVKKFSISAFESPNLKAAGIENIEQLIKTMTPPEGVDPLDHEPFKNVKWPIPELISPERVYERYLEWGADSPAWQALVMGEFPTQAEQSLIPMDLVRQAMDMQTVDVDSGQTYAELSGWNIPEGPPEYGVDMARYGGDSTVVYPRRGGWVEQATVWNKTDLMTSADKILKIVDPLDFNTRINIDDTGNGGGTTDRLRQISSDQRTTGSPVHQYQLAAYNFSSKERMGNPAKFHDITSELYWNLRSWFYKKQIALPQDDQLFRELVGRRWHINKSGKIQVESKEEYKKRTGGKSPDRSDALALAFAGGLRQSEQRTPDLSDYESDEEVEPTMQPFTSGLSRHGW